MKEIIQNENSAPQFSKAELAASDKFRGQQDLIEALLQDDRKYSVDEADRIVGDFMKGRVR